ncbi:MAG: Rpn family recombination-promoting nuclease/putative transposase [Caldilineaceae bacterium]
MTYTRCMNIHDSGYKYLFSFVAFFRQLVESFVEESWVATLDFDRATLLDKSFVSAEYAHAEADLLWQVPLQGRTEAVYFYLLLEFQSTVPRLMALRVGQYLLNAKSDLQRLHNHATVLPQIFPLVLYNGKERWTAPVNLRALEEQVVDLGDYGIEVHYLPIIENSYPLERLLQEVNLVSTLFMAEAYYDRERLIRQLLDLYEREDPAAVSALANWFRQMALHKRIPPEDYVLLKQEYRSKEELQTMIVEAILQEEAQIRKESEAKGKREMNRQHVQRMLAKGYLPAVIADLLGLSEEEVQTLSQATEPLPPALPN